MSGEDLLVGLLLGAIITAILWPWPGAYWVIHHLRGENEMLRAQLDDGQQKETANG